MDFSHFDKRNYPTLGVEAGYREWASVYEATVLDLMDLALLAHLKTVDWKTARRVVDLACGTGRVGVWLKAQGVRFIDGIDITSAMLEKAKEKRVYDQLETADVTATGLDEDGYDLATMSLADEHLAELAPLYLEAARLLSPSGKFVLVGYHPHFLMMGVPTHFNRVSGEPVAVESYVHSTSDHVTAARASGFLLLEMVEGFVDDAWIAAKPKWEKFRNHPVSFAFVWEKL